MRAAKEGLVFRDLVATDPAVAAALSSDDLDKIFDPWDQLHNLDATFERLGLNEPALAGFTQ